MNTVAQPTLDLGEFLDPVPEGLDPVAFAEPLPGPPLFAVHPTPVADLLLTGDGRSLTGLYMLPDHRHGPTVQEDWRESTEAFAEVVAQLDQYFGGERRTFDLPLAPKGTPFQLSVWTMLTTIPHGRTVSYGEIAHLLGRPTASRAVGMANGRNPISIVVPCHRVVGSTGSLTGYGGGLPRKHALLELERGR